MDFARKQLQKYGWTDGKGLGKYENGISEALKPKLKRSVTGVGHDAAAEFTEHWWTKLYNNAASNVEVKEKNGQTKKIKTKDDEFEITNSSWSYKKKNKSKSKEEYTNFFVKTSILTSGGVKTENLDNSDNEIDCENKGIVKLTDEELFVACEGRTAHKGARHGLKALGKLARIEKQEQMLLLQSKYEGYSHAKKDCKLIENTSLLSDSEDKNPKRKKKKKRCSLSDIEFKATDNEIKNNADIENDKEEKKDRNTTGCNEKLNCSTDTDLIKLKKSKYKKVDTNDFAEIEVDISNMDLRKCNVKNKDNADIENVIDTSKTKKRKNYIAENNSVQNEDLARKSRKKKKGK
ncbi:unnamed protein product [Leptosia nina]|uniref:G patch domain-containing protein 4 n=1 Tax=Leptosia nina TaxID=320188 RepID=A0AAV1JK93_9NEOP